MPFPKSLVNRIAATALLLLAGSTARADGPPPTPEPPANVSSSGRIAGAQEPGTPLIVTGKVFAPDGVTPAPNVFVYAYQTDQTGLYHNDANRVARLHGWAKTDGRGRFEFRTIRPGAYPGRNVAAHIHLHVWGGGYPLQWTPDIRFADDPLLKPEDIQKSETEGKFGNIRPVTRNADGPERCTFNIRASKATNYPVAYRDDPRTK